MKNDESKYDFHVGSMIKQLASYKNVTPKQLAEAIGRYPKNETKIFQLADMYANDVILISVLLENNILATLCEKYLPLLPVAHNLSEQESCSLKFDLQTKHYSFCRKAANTDFLQQTHVGQYIRALAKEKKWSEQDVAGRMGWTQDKVSELYNTPVLKIKRLFLLSEALQHHFPYHLYLSKIAIFPSLDDFHQSIITIHEGTIQIENPHNETFFITLRNGQ